MKGWPFLVLLAACASEKIASGLVLEARGEVRCNGEAIGPGDEVFSGDEIQVDRGRLEIEVVDVGRMRIFESTKLQLSGKPHAHRLLLASGMVWALVTKLGHDTFEIEGQNAVAGVRGTEFIVEATDGDDDVRVTKGEVEVVSKHDSTSRRATAGERVRTKRRAAPSAPERYDNTTDHARWSDLRQATSEIKNGFKKGGRAIRDESRNVGRKLRNLFR